MIHFPLLYCKSNPNRAQRALEKQTKKKTKEKTHLSHPSFPQWCERTISIPFTEMQLSQAWNMATG